MFRHATDLPLCLSNGAVEEDYQSARDIIWCLPAAVRLLDQLDWHEHGGRESYEIIVDDVTARFMQRREQHSVDWREDLRGDLPRGGWPNLSDEEFVEQRKQICCDINSGLTGSTPHGSLRPRSSRRWRDGGVWYDRDHRPT